MNFPEEMIVYRLIASISENYCRQITLKRVEKKEHNVHRGLHVIPNSLLLCDRTIDDIMSHRLAVYLFVSHQSPDSDTGFDQHDSRQNYGKLDTNERIILSSKTWIII